MRGIARFYSTVACLFLGAAITAALFAVIAARLAPEWLEEAGGSLSRGIARITGGATPSLAGGNALPVPPPAPARREPPAAVVPAAFGNEGGEGVVRAADRAVRGRRDAEAWRAVEGSLSRLLEALGDGEACRLGAGAGIADAAPRIVERLERLTRERLEGKRTLVESLEPRALARVLMDDGSISDARAQEILDGIEPAARAEVIDRLSRLAPRRAARLLDRVLGGGTAEAARGPSGRGNEKG